MRGYILVENLGLTAPQKATLIAGLRALGPATHPQPAWLNHARVRLDGDAAIIETDWGANDITAVGLRNRLAALFGVAQTSVTYATANVTLAVRPSPYITFSYQAVAKLRAGVFGGQAASWDESHTEVLAYLAANSAAWEETTPL